MNKLFLSAFCILLLEVCDAAIDKAEKFPIASTSSGQLRGLRVVKSEFEVFQYLGVPYAQPPVGELRFQRPKPLASSSSLKHDATKHAPTCIQMRHLPQVISPLLDVDEEHNVSEDCLYLNVYVPIKNGTSQENLPVMIWLPGEGFDFADARQFDGTYLASMGNVIVITVQYRVGVFGFLKDGSNSPGNMGIWDQLEAIQWVKKNAKAFGGDPDNITLFGRFTGSMSISILLTSPVTRIGHDFDLPLFKRALLISGVAVGGWVFDFEPETKTRNLLEATGCSDINCLKNMSANELLQEASIGWRPTVDGTLITEEPLKALEKGKFARNVSEVMFGTNEYEGSLCLLTHFASKSKYYDLIVNNQLSESNLFEMIESDMKTFVGKNFANNDHSKVLISSVFNKNQDTSFRKKYLEFCSTLFISSHMNLFNKLLVKRDQDNQNQANMTLTKTYSYQFQHRPSFSIAPSFIDSSMHGDDVLFAFGLIFKSPLVSEEDKKLTKHFINSLSNFAHFGNPNGRLSNVQHLWSRYKTTLFKSNLYKNEENEIVGVTQIYLLSNTAEILLTFLTTSTTVLAMVTTSLIVFLIVYLYKHQQTNHLRKCQSLL